MLKVRLKSTLKINKISYLPRIYNTNKNPFLNRWEKKSDFKLNPIVIEFKKMIPYKVKEMIRFLTSLIIILRVKENYKVVEILFNVLSNRIYLKSQARLLKIYNLHSRDLLKIFLYLKANQSYRIKLKINWHQKNIRLRDFSSWANQER